jgi:hypothetical protein
MIGSMIKDEEWSGGKVNNHVWACHYVEVGRI